MQNQSTDLHINLHAFCMQFSQPTGPPQLIFLFLDPWRTVALRSEARLELPLGRAGSGSRALRVRSGCLPLLQHLEEPRELRTCSGAVPGPDLPPHKLTC